MIRLLSIICLLCAGAAFGLLAAIAQQFGLNDTIGIGIAAVCGAGCAGIGLLWFAHHRQSARLKDMAAAIPALHAKLAAQNDTQDALSAMVSRFEAVEAQLASPRVHETPDIGGEALIAGGDAERALHLPEEIASAILANRVDLYVQAAHALPSRRPVFFECLSRLRNNGGDLLYPSKFMETAVRARLVPTLDNFILLRCVHIIRNLGRKADLERFFVNIAQASLEDADFFSQMTEFLADNTSLAPHLVLEFARDAYFALPETSRKALFDLNQAGFQFSLDQAEQNDVGGSAAEAGFAYLKVPAREIAAMADPGSFFAEARAQDQTVIATFVEDEKTLIALLEAGAPLAQGYALGRPRAWADVLISKGLADAA